ncbi:MAG: hypothetical protein ACRYHQ_33100 [Janthinobacterium lividum]
MPFQSSSRRKRPITVANSWANSSIAPKHPGSFRVAVQQQPVELLLADVFAGHIPNRIVVNVAHTLPHVVQDGAECPPARTVADEAGFVAQLGNVGIDVHGGQTPGAMPDEARYQRFSLVNGVQPSARCFGEQAR